MSLLDDLGKLVSGSGGSGAELHAAYDEATRNVSQGTLAEGLTHTFNSSETPPFEQMLAGLFKQSNPDQKAGVLNQVLGTLGSGQASSILASLGLSGAAGAVAGGAVSPQQAQQVPPQAVEELAKRAAAKNPSIVDQAAGFYAQHPTLVKSIGAGALALLMSRISQSRRQA